MKGMGGHQSGKVITNTWLTPPEIIAALGAFDLDPATPETMPWQTAAERFTEKEDGLAQDWFGRVWLNPPYTIEVIRWMRKLADHGDGIALVFARTETEWFFETVWPQASAVLFLKGRIFFHRANGSRAKENSGEPSALIAYGTRNVEALRNSGIEGQLVVLEGGAR